MNVDWRQLFQAYAAAALGGDAEATAAFYAPSFMAAGPQGSACFQNDDQFLAWLRQVHAFNEQAGMESLTVVSVATRPLGEHFVSVSVQWGATFRKTADELIKFTITYIIESPGGSPKIVMYVSHEDQEETMRANGLLPDSIRPATE